jgi:hypothetical protein
MTNQSTLDLLVSLGLHGMAKGFKELEAQSRASSLDHAQWLALLLEQEQKLGGRPRRFRAPTRESGLAGARWFADSLSFG